MAKNKLDDLRNHLFEQLEALRDAAPEGLETELRRSEAVVSVAKQITETARVEVEYCKNLDASSASQFWEGRPDQPRRLDTGKPV